MNKKRCYNCKVGLRTLTAKESVKIPEAKKINKQQLNVRPIYDRQLLWATKRGKGKRVKFVPTRHYIKYNPRNQREVRNIILNYRERRLAGRNAVRYKPPVYTLRTRFGARPPQARLLARAAADERRFLFNEYRFRNSTIPSIPVAEVVQTARVIGVEREVPTLNRPPIPYARYPPHLQLPLPRYYRNMLPQLAEQPPTPRDPLGGNQQVLNDRAPTTSTEPADNSRPTTMRTTNEDVVMADADMPTRRRTMNDYRLSHTSGRTPTHSLNEVLADIGMPPAVSALMRANYTRNNVDPNTPRYHLELADSDNNNI